MGFNSVFKGLRTSVSDVTLHIVEEGLSTMTCRSVNSESDCLMGGGAVWSGRCELKFQRKLASSWSGSTSWCRRNVPLKYPDAHKTTGNDVAQAVVWTVTDGTTSRCSLFDSQRLRVWLLELWNLACAVVSDEEFWSEQTHEGVGSSLLEGCLSLPVECVLAKGHTVNRACFQVLPFCFHSTVSRMLNWYNHWRR